MRIRSSVISILTCFFFWSFYGSAQSEFGLSFSGGLSKITNNMDKIWTFETLKVLLQPSASGGIYYTHNFKTNGVFRTEFLLNQINGKEKYIDSLNGPTGSEGYTKGTLVKHFSYLSLPFYYGMKLQKISFGLGIQPSILIASRGKDKGSIFYHGNLNSTYNRPTKGFAGKHIDFGLKADLSYEISDKISVTSNYYYGMVNLLEANVPSWRWKSRQISLGLRYKLKP